MGWVKIATNESVLFHESEDTRIGASGVVRDRLIVNSLGELTKQEMTLSSSGVWYGAWYTAKTYAKSDTGRYKIIVKSITISPQSWASYMDHQPGYEQEVTTNKIFLPHTNYSMYNQNIITYVDIYKYTNDAPTNTTIPAQSTQLNTNKSLNVAPYFSDADGDTLTFAASSSNTAVGTVAVSGSTLTLRPVSLGSTTITVTANDGKGGTKSTTFTFSVVNSAPTISLTNPNNNTTLYGNDTFNIAGTASDADNGNAVTIRYQINANTVRAIKAFISAGTAESFSKQLTFKGGSLYDGDTLIASNLADGTAHTLKVWATDDQGGTSPIVERTFYVVPNRAPSLTVNPPVINGLIDSDTITIDGAWNDADGNNATVAYRINGGNSVQVAQGVSGDFDFDIMFGQLKDGVNNIAVEVTDSYGAKTTRTVRLNKTAIAVPQLRSTARYKIEPPQNSAKSVLLWVTRSQNLTIDVALSMTMTGEAENLVPVAASNSAPNTAVAADAIEDEFYREVDTPVDNIVLQIDMTRASEQDNAVIYLLQGVLE